MTDRPLGKDPAFTSTLAGLAPAGIAIGHRLILPGDEDCLLPDESAAFAARAVRVRRQSGAARFAARELLADLGLGAAAVPRSDTGAPLWPSGLVGSLAHDELVAVATIARSPQFSALGIDVEPAVPLPIGIVARIATEGELQRYATPIVESRLLFALKEAVFKALNPLDGRFLDFHDIEIDLDARRGQTRGGESVAIAWTITPRVVALAFR